MPKRCGILATRLGDLSRMLEHYADPFFADVRLLIATGTAALASALLIAVLLRLRQVLPMDHPNHRSLHATPIPRTGGIGILLGASAGWLLGWSVQPPDWSTSLEAVLVLALGLGALSLVDDFRGLSVKLRFAAQIAAAAAFVLLLPELPGGVLGAGLALFALVWAANLYNFMDGANGLAGGMAVFGFGCYAIAATLHTLNIAFFDGFELAVASACVAAAAAGFLLFNFDPARIFMGDVGSVPLGFLAAGLGLMGWQKGVWPLAFPLLVFSPFIVDASVTLLKRLWRGEKIWQAHREHYYQRLIQMGLGHRRTALLEYGLMLACGLSAMVLLLPYKDSGYPSLYGWTFPLKPSFNPVSTPILLAWLALYAVLMVKIDKAWARHLKNTRHD